MARIKCKCKTVISNSSNPEIEYLVFGDEEWSGLLDMKISNALDIPLPAIHFWKCPNCSRIILFNESNTPIAIYKLEEGAENWDG